MAVVAETEERPWLEELNDEQRAAATHTGGPLLILAGAGTGKTTTLCARVAWLVTEGVPAERILLLTFTRRASREMLQRARGLVPASVAGARAGPSTRSRTGSCAGTPPRWGCRAASACWTRATPPTCWTCCARSTGTRSRKTRFPKQGDAAGHLLAHGQRAGAAVGRDRASTSRGARSTARRSRRCSGPTRRASASSGVADLDDLLLFWRALAADEVIGPLLAASFDHVLIDEYQDVNGLQVDLARSLASHGPEVTAVGDDFQAIYGFRSASAAHILDFPEHFPGTRVVTLERNYRSTQPVLDAANALAAQATRAFPKRLRADREGGVRPRVVHVRDEAAQAEEVCDRILEAREQGMELRAQAVLARTSHDSDLLELELTRRRIPFHKYGGLRYLEAAHVKDFVATLRLVDNGADDVAWFRVLQLVEGVGPVSARTAIEAMARGARRRGDRRRGDRRRGVGATGDGAHDDGADGATGDGAHDDGAHGATGDGAHDHGAHGATGDGAHDDGADGATGDGAPRGADATLYHAAINGGVAPGHTVDRLAAWPAARAEIPAAARPSADGLIAALYQARHERGHRAGGGRSDQLPGEVAHFQADPGRPSFRRAISVSPTERWRNGPAP